MDTSSLCIMISCKKANTDGWKIWRKTWIDDWRNLTNAGADGSLNRLMSVKMMQVICYGLQSQKISTQWKQTDVLRPRPHHHLNSRIDSFQWKRTGESWPCTFANSESFFPPSMWVQSWEQNARWSEQHSAVKKQKKGCASLFPAGYLVRS